MCLFVCICICKCVILKHVELLILCLGISSEKETGGNKTISSAWGWNGIVGADSEMISNLCLVTGNYRYLGNLKT